MSVRPLCFISALILVGVASAQLPKQAHDDHEYDLLDVDWHVAVDFEPGTITGDVTQTLKTTRDNALLVFDCPKLTVDQVVVNGRDSNFEDNGTVMAVRTEARKGTTLKVRIKYHGAPEAGVYFVKAKYAYPAHTPVVYTQGEMVDNRYWLPIYDWPDDKATSSGSITVPKGWKALSNGRLLGVSHSKGTDTWHWKIGHQHSTYLIAFTAGLYDIVPDGTTAQGKPVSIWVPQGLGSWGKAAFGGTDKVIDFYGKITGYPYPWEKYAQSAVPDFMFGGMENVTCTTQTIDALFPPQDAGYRDGTGLVAHELAHQWFGDTVTCTDWPHAWINEGWASFLPAFWQREKNGRDTFDLDRAGTMDGAIATAYFQRDRTMIWNKYKDPFDLFDGFAYGGGAARMFMLMHMVGEDKFWPAVRDYLRARQFENVTTEQFFASMSKSTGKDLDAFRRQWFYTKGCPDLTVVRSDGKTFIKQGAYKLEYPVPLEYWLVDQDGRVEKRTTTLSEEPRFEIQGAAGRAVLLDPGCWLMARTSYQADYSDKEWEALYRAATDAGCRSRLMQHIRELPVADQIQLANAEKVPSLVARFVGSIRDKDFVMAKLNSPDKEVVAAAISAMGRLPKDEEVTKKLEEIWRSPSYPEFLRERALSALFQVEPSNELADEAWTMSGQTAEFKTKALEYWTEKMPDKARRICLMAAREDSTPQPVRMAALRDLGMLKDAPGQHVVYDTLVAYLKERSNSPLRTAIGALANYGDPAAIPLIEAHKDHSLFFVRQDVERALRKLRKQE